MVKMLIVFSFCMFVLVYSENSSLCPQSCICTKVKERVPPPILRSVNLKCGARDYLLTSIEELDLKNIVNNSEIFTL